MKQMIKKICISIAITVVLISSITDVTAHASDINRAEYEEINVGDERLIVCPSAYPYSFIVIWEDPEGLDILTYPWTGYNNGLRSDVAYRLKYGERFQVNGVVRNNRGNVFLRLEDGFYVYSGDVAFDFDENGQRMDDYHCDNMGEFYLTFYKMCQDGGVMDVKTLDPSSKKIPYNAYYRLEHRMVTKTAEQLGNELYGYVGSKIGISKPILGSANLLAQRLKGYFNWEEYLYSYNDSPEDADSIDEGIDYYFRTH